MKTYRAIGLMSGTSLDGLDIAACEFYHDDGTWKYNILASHTYPYSREWKVRLENLPDSDALTFSLTNVEYGHFIGRLTKSFIDRTGFIPDLIASHGHTVFHQPDKGLTVQIGAGSAIASETGYPVICDFRTTDVALGGQGAPLVPIGDRLLFKDYDACLNLGGFANISFEQEDTRMAYDICPVNIILNKLASGLGMNFDLDGMAARRGEIDPVLLKRLNALEYYNQKHPKSLAREWLENEFIPVLNNTGQPVINLLNTVCEHIAFQINKALPTDYQLNVLVTGGGALNIFLIEKIRESSPHHFVVPDPQLINFKEALVFAFLGTLRSIREINIFRSVTGSKIDHTGGAEYRLI